MEKPKLQVVSGMKSRNCNPDNSYNKLIPTEYMSTKLQSLTLYIVS